MGGADVAAGEAILNRAGIPTFAYPDTAARAFTAHVAVRHNLRSSTRRPGPGRADEDEPEPRRGRRSSLASAPRAAPS